MTAVVCPDDNLLGQLIDGALGDRERVTLERHLDACAACTQLVVELGLASPARAVPPRYRLIGRLGGGAMGEVWEAEDTALARAVALKFVRPDAAAAPEYRARLLREARALAQVRHPGVVAIHDLGELDGELFIALERVAGMPLPAWLRGAPPAAAILRVWGNVGAGLAAVHAAGLVHRDIKPDNVVVTRDGHGVLVDFGLATGERIAADALTATGAVVGTPQYMALEQLRGGDATPHSDQLALAICIWESLTGAPPFSIVGSPPQRALAMLARPARPPRLSRALYLVLARALAPEPGARFASIDALLAGIARAARRWW